MQRNEAIRLDSTCIKSVKSTTCCGVSGCVNLYELFLPPCIPDTCSTNIYGIRPFVLCLPAWFRFAQCLRRYRDTKHIFPHLVNAGKYSTTFFIVIFSTLAGMEKGMRSDYTCVWFAICMFSSVSNFFPSLALCRGKLFEQRSIFYIMAC